ncbi:hypothetical protein N7G274_007664 [Stereocaulon virgatum]|uniref:Uncharacterized protein n=1 Tax=Stereocaulon virgatum TaxID=373712 RepID=A0ABR4A4S7_9LECA
MTNEPVVDHDPFEPAETHIRIHGLYEANKRAQVSSLNDAVEAMRNGWESGPAECYRNTTEKVRLGTALERSILNWDIQQSNPQVLEHFSQNLLFLCLNLLEHCDTAPTLDLLARDEND